ncbi:hypothetical protein D3C73_791880 [compost metagenome]
MIADRLLAELEGADAEIAVILREMLTQCDSKAGLVAGGRHLCRVRQAVCIAVSRSGHAERAGLVGHQLRETFFRAADIFTECRCHVIGGASYKSTDRLVYGHRAAGAHAELGRWLLGGIG